MEKLLAANITTYHNVKASISGVTVLHSHKFKSRYNGSKSLIVTPEGEIQRHKKLTFPKERKEPVNRRITYRINKAQVRHRLLNFINSQTGRKQLFFFTISFPKQITDATAYMVLNSTLTTLRHNNKSFQYVWIAERQQIGTIHFHIATGTYFNVRFFNGVVKNLLHSHIRSKRLDWSHSACSKYNGVDIAKDRKTRKVVNFAKGNSQKSLANYLTKYISKSSISFNRQAWQSSRKIAAMFTAINLNHEEAERLLSAYIDINEPIFVDTHYCYFAWIKKPPDVIKSLLHEVNSAILNDTIVVTETMLAASGVKTVEPLAASVNHHQQAPPKSYQLHLFLDK